MTAPSDVNLEKCALFKCLWRVWSCALAAGQLHLLLKYSLIFGHTDKNNESFESVNTVNFYALTQNKTLHFCKIMKANRMHFRVSVSVNLSAKLYVSAPYRYEMSTFK